MLSKSAPASNQKDVASLGWRYVQSRPEHSDRDGEHDGEEGDYH